MSDDQVLDDKDQKIQELEANWKRAVADYKNLERRCAEDKDAIVKFSNFVLLERLVPVLDNLETLKRHLDDKGLEIVLKQLSDLIKDAGVEEIACVGEEFDPYLMEASEVIEGADNKVMDVVVKGYKYYDKVLRPARVRVGKRKE